MSTAVIIATPDHWHAHDHHRMPSHAGKDVYCEKPMVQTIAEGREVVEAQKKTGRILQVGSQYASSLVFQKATELHEVRRYRRTEHGGSLA